MLFTNEQDEALVDELDTQGVFSRSLWSKLAPAGDERASMVLLRRGYSLVKPGAWKLWLLQRHGMLPLSRLSVSREWVTEQAFAPALASQFRTAAVMPIRRLSGNAWLVAAMLPADRAIWSSRLGGPVHFAAAAPAEMNALLLNL